MVFNIFTNFKKMVLVALWVCLITSLSVTAQPYIQLDNTDTIELEDHELWFKTQAVNTPPNFLTLNRLYESANSVASTLGGSGAYITRINLSNNRSEQNTWFVNVHMNYLDIGTAYWLPNQGTPILLEQFGQTQSNNPKLAHSQTFSLSLSEHESGTLWIYVKAKVFAIPADVTIYSKTDFYSKQFYINSVTTISYTIMITLALIAGFIYLRLKTLVTLTCAGYIGLHGLGWFAASGSLGHLFNVQSFNPVYAGFLLFPFAIAAASQFTKLLFNCQQDHIKLAKAFNVLSIVCLCVGTLIPFIPFEQSFLITHIIAVIWIPLCIGTGIFMLRKKDFRAKYYLTGNLFYGLALAIYVLSHAYNLDLKVDSELIVLVALTVDCFCILLSLSEWLQIQQKEFVQTYNTSRIDPLTQVGNRLAQNEMLANLSEQYSLTFIDLDNLKTINDKFGHDTGDKYIIAAVNILQQKMQGLGALFRCGGDEFILIAPVEQEDQVNPLLNKISKLIKEAEQELRLLGWQSAGLSFGIASSFETSNQSECLSLADQRMYDYKKENKQVVLI